MITVSEFGQLESGETCMLYTITNNKGSSVSISNYGARVVSLNVFDKQKELRDVVLGFDTLEQYVNDTNYIGCMVGRYAGRIAGAEYKLNGHTYRLDANENGNTLHGGFNGFDKKVWRGYIAGQNGTEVLSFRYDSVDGECGFNGDLSVTVEYMWTSDDSLIIDVFASSEVDTLCNLTNHMYFNLDGAGERLYYHKVRIFANSINEIDSNKLATGNVLSLSGGLDLNKGRQLKTLKSRHQLVKATGGYDFTYRLNKKNEGLARAAIVRSVSSGIKMEVYTTLPSVQFYTGNSLNGAVGKGGKVYGKQSGLCVETQLDVYSPNSDKFPLAVLKSDEIYHNRTVYRFCKHK